MQRNLLLYGSFHDRWVSQGLSHSDTLSRRNILNVSLISCLVFTSPRSFTIAYIFHSFIVGGFISALKVAFAKLRAARVSPLTFVQTSFIPAISSTFLAVPPEAIPSPLGAGNSLTSTLPVLPFTSKGTVWPCPQPHSHEPQPRLMPITFILAVSIAFRIAIPTWTSFPSPMPIKPSPLPTMTVALNFTLLPESLILWTILISRTSSLISGSNASTI